MVFRHGKFEAVGSLSISALLILTAGGIGWQAIESIKHIMSNVPLLVPSGVALVGALVAILVKEVLFRRTKQIADVWNSKVLLANAWHHRTDSISSFVALVGVAGAMVELPILDPLAGIVVSALIVKAGGELAWDSLKELTDQNVDKQLLTDVQTLLNDMRDEGVLSYHRLRGRRMGPYVLMDVHISVSPTISVSAAHQVAERVRIHALRKFHVISEVRYKEIKQAIEITLAIIILMYYSAFFYFCFVLLLVSCTC
jgi:cation diffusion facilitator family transporter